MKRLLISASAILLLFSACGEVDPDPTPTPTPEPKPVSFNQRLTIVHERSSFQVPSLSGSGVSGRVDFGDGNTQDYRYGLTGTYPSAGQHRVVIECTGATSFSMESVADVSQIDLSAF